jgi:hypothetical protein
VAKELGDLDELDPKAKPTTLSLPQATRKKINQLRKQAGLLKPAHVVARAIDLFAESSSLDTNPRTSPPYLRAGLVAIERAARFDLGTWLETYARNSEIFLVVPTDFLMLMKNEHLIELFRDRVERQVGTAIFPLHHLGNAPLRIKYADLIHSAFGGLENRLFSDDSAPLAIFGLPRVHPYACFLTDTQALVLHRTGGNDFFAKAFFIYENDDSADSGFSEVLTQLTTLLNFYDGPPLAPDLLRDAFIAKGKIVGAPAIPDPDERNVPGSLSS